MWLIYSHHDLHERCWTLLLPFWLTRTYFNSWGWSWHIHRKHVNPHLDLSLKYKNCTYSVLGMEGFGTECSVDSLPCVKDTMKFVRQTGDFVYFIGSTLLNSDWKHFSWLNWSILTYWLFTLNIVHQRVIYVGPPWLSGNDLWLVIISPSTLEFKSQIQN